MKLNAYTDTVNKNTIGNNARYNSVGPIEAYADSTNAEMLNTAGGLLVGFAAQKEKEFEEHNNLALMDAQTDYNKRINDLLYNKENGLANTELGGANGITERFRVEEKKIRSEVLQGLPQYEEVHGAFNAFAEEGSVGFNTTLQKHEAKEYKKYKEVSYANAQEANTNGAALAYNNPQMVGLYVTNALQTASVMYQDQGAEVVEEKQREALNNIAKPTIENAIENEDYNAANNLINEFKKIGVSADILIDLEAKTVEKQENLYLDELSDEAVRLYPHDLAKQEAYIANQLIELGRVNETDLSKAIAPYIGMQYVLGGDGVNGTDCGKFTLDVYAKNGIDLGSRAADEQYINLSKQGKIVDKKDIKNGDLVFYHVAANDERWTPTDDINAVDGSHAYKGITHVGIYMNGEVVQAGSQGVGAIPLDSYEVVGVGRPSEGKLEEMSATKKAGFVRKAKEKLVGANGRRSKEETQLINDTYDEMMVSVNDMILKDVPVNKVADYVENIARQNPLYMGSKIGKLAASLRKSSMSAADGGNININKSSTKNYGGKADGRTMYALKVNIQNGMSDDDVYKMVEELNLTPSQQLTIHKELESRRKYEGEYAPEMQGVKEVLKHQYDLSLKKGEFDYLWQGVSDAIAPKVQEFIKTHGYKPSKAELASMANEVMTMKQLTLVGEDDDFRLWYFDDDETLNVSEADLAIHGIHLERVVSNDGDPYVRIITKDGDYRDIAPKEAKQELRRMGIDIG